MYQLIPFHTLLTDISLQGAIVIYGDPENVRTIYNQIPGSQAIERGFYIYPCNSILPDIVFHFDGVAFPISQNFNQGIWAHVPGNCLGSISENQGNDININTWVLGAAFMANYYTVFNVGTKKVGFATLAVA
jgi:hypothetical protein